MVARTAAIALSAKSEDATKADANELKEFVGALFEAPDGDARAALLKNARPNWKEEYRIRKAWAGLVFQQTQEGDVLHAEASARRLKEFAAETHDEEGIAVARTTLSAVLRNLGQYRDALAELEQALDFYRHNAADSRGLISVYQGIGIAKLYQADFSGALANFHHALTEAEQAKDREAIIPALNSIGEVYRTQGQPERALTFYEKARAQVGDDNAWNMAFIFNNIGQSYAAIGDTAKALEMIERARVIAERVKFRPRVATSLAVIGSLHLARHELAAAKEAYEQSRALSVELHDRASEARAALGLAQCAREEHDFADSIEHAELAARLYESVGERTGLAAAETEAGRALRGLGQTDNARAAFEKAITQIEQVRTQIAGGAAESQSFFATQVGPYAELVSMNVAAGETAEALSMAERASARTLLDILSSGKPDIEGSMDEPERARDRLLGRRVAELNRSLGQARAAAPRDDKRIARLETELTDARDAHDGFEAELLALHPEWKRAMSSAQPATMADVERLVGAEPKRVFLKFTVTPTETFLFVAHRSTEGAKLDVFPLQLAGEALVQRITRFRQALATRSLDWQSLARALYDGLLKTSAAAWTDADSVVIVPDGPLWELPFQALQADGRCLLEKYTISYAPALGFLTRAEGRTQTPPSSRKLLAVGNPALTAVTEDAAAMLPGEWAPLPATGTQLSGLREIYGASRSEVLDGEKATEKRFQTDARDSDVLHFATHGVLNNRAPLYSHLVFAQTHLGPDEDGLLEARELMRMDLRARLAVISACETARGGISAGEGVIGLSWAFLLAGCPTTVVSEWKVDSESTTDLMLEFHCRSHAGDAPATALRAASLALAKNPKYRHPFYWAPFVVVGANR